MGNPYLQQILFGDGEPEEELELSQEKLASIGILQKFAEADGEELSDEEMAELAELDEDQLAELIGALAGSEEGQEGEYEEEADDEASVTAEDILGLPEGSLEGVDKESSFDLLAAHILGQQTADGIMEGIEKEAGRLSGIKKLRNIRALGKGAPRTEQGTTVGEILFGAKPGATRISNRAAKAQAEALARGSGAKAKKALSRKRLAKILGGTAAGGGSLAALLAAAGGEGGKTATSSAVDTLAENQAVQIAEQFGLQKTAEAEEYEGEASVDDQINYRALEMLDEAGYDISPVLEALGVEAE